MTDDERVTLNQKDFLRLFRTDLVKLGGAELARQIGVSPQHISDVKGGNREPGPKILDFYGLEKTVEVVRRVTYTFKK